MRRPEGESVTNVMAELSALSCQPSAKPDLVQAASIFGFG